MAFKSSKKFRFNENEVVECLSKGRIASYENVAKRKEIGSIMAVYSITQLMSSFLFPPLQYLEVTLRNKTHATLMPFYARNKNKPGGADPERWLFWMPQNSRTKESVLDAERYAKRDIKDRPILIDDIIPRIHFGTWIKILAEQPDNKAPLHFWQHTARDIFPNAPKKRQSFVIEKLSDINTIRNRLFHFEPVWRNKNCKNAPEIAINIKKIYKRIADIIFWLSKDMHYAATLLQPDWIIDEIIKESMSFSWE